MRNVSEDPDDSEREVEGLPDKIELKPVIKELLRTQVCPIQPMLLIDRVIIVTLPHKRKGYINAYRLYLTDGEMSIQGKSMLCFQSTTYADHAT